MAEMNFDQIKERLDYFERTFKNATKSLKEFIKELEGGDSSRFQAWVDQLEEMQKAVIGNKKEFEDLNNRLKTTQENIEMMNKLYIQGGMHNKRLKKMLDEQIEARKMILNQLEHHNSVIKSNLADQEKLNNLVISTIKSTDQFLGNMSKNLNIKSFHDSFFYKMMKSFRDGGQDADNMGIAIKSIGGRLKDMLEPLNLTANIFSTMVNSTVAMVTSLDETLSGFQKNTGIVGTYNSVMYDAYRNNLEYSVSLKEVAEATEYLIKDMQSFNLMNMQNKQELIETVSLYQKFGASTHELTEFLGRMTDTFKMTVGGTKELLGELRGLHANIGGPFRRIIDNFNDSLGRLSRFGLEGAKKSFKEISVLALSLKIEYKDLLKITDETFDSYESGAKAVSRFNAIAGGPYLNTISMMKQSNEERIKSLIGAIQQSRIHYDLLSAQEKQAIANSVGITDMTVAQKIFTGSLSDYYRLRAITNESEAEAKDRAQSLASIQDKLNSIFESFAIIVEPILTVLRALLSVVRDIVLFIKDHFIAAIGILAGVAGLGLLLSKIGAVKNIFREFVFMAKPLWWSFTDSVKGSFGIFGKLGEVVGKVFKGITSAVTGVFKGIINFFASIAPAAFTAAGAMIAFGIGLAFVGAGIWLIAKGIQAIVDIFSGKAISSEEASIIERMARIPEGTDTKINNLTSSIENLSDAVSDLNYSKLKEMLDLLDEIAEKTKNLTSQATISITRNIADMFESAGKITTSNVTEIRSVVNEIVRVGSETEVAKYEAAKEFASSASKGGSSGASSGQPVLNVIELNGREMARWFSQQLDSLKIDITKQKQK